MSQSRVFGFLMSVFVMIVMLSIVIPSNGVEIFGIRIQFPSLKDISRQLSQEPEVHTLSPDEILEQRRAAARLAEADRFDDIINSNPARIWFPDSDVTAFDSFFASLDKASSVPVRIMHYGDSQLEEDRITDVIRDSLQARFGGLGPGLLPLDKYYTRRISEYASYHTRKYSVYGFIGGTRKDGLYGPMGLVSRLDSSIVVSIAPAKRYESLSSRFSRLTFLFGRSDRDVTVKCGSTVQKLPADGDVRDLRMLRFELPDSSSKVSFFVSSGIDVYGIMLDGNSGVSVDNIPMRGGTGEVFTRMESNHICDYANYTGVRLVILQFGGNVVPYTSQENAIASYCASISKQIQHIRELIPDACILFIGPSDMSTNVKGEMKTYPHLSEFIEELKRSCNEAGAAYWDMHAAMGGDGSMASWVKARPALAGSDHVHFTRAGSTKIGEILYGTLALYYDFYKFRTAQ